MQVGIGGQDQKIIQMTIPSNSLFSVVSILLVQQFARIVMSITTTYGKEDKSMHGSSYVYPSLINARIAFSTLVL